MEEYTIVANTRGKADVWRHFGLRKRKADGTIVEKTAVCLTRNTVVKTSGCTTNMMTHIRTCTHRFHSILILLLIPFPEKGLLRRPRCTLLILKYFCV